jgi:hypothetical protein
VIPAAPLAPAVLQQAPAARPAPAVPVQLSKPVSRKLFVWEPVRFPRSLLHPGKHEWVEAQPPSCGCSGTCAAQSLTVVTWNVFFGQLSAQRRWQAILDETFRQSALPDVVAFQEVTAAFVELVRGHGVVRERYAITELSAEGGGWYGVMLLVRRAAVYAVECWETALPTHMSRTLLSAVIKASPSGSAVVVSTLHAESLGSALCRKQQLAIAGEFGKPYSWHMIGEVLVFPHLLLPQPTIGVVFSLQLATSTLEMVWKMALFRRRTLTCGRFAIPTIHSSKAQRAKGAL